MWPQGRQSSPLPDGFGSITSVGTGLTQMIRDGRPWCIDNEAYTRGFRARAYFRLLKRLEPYRDRCLFCTIPDVVGNAIETLALYRNWLHHWEGWPIAFVAQDGQEDLAFPNYFDWLFVGGSTAWKMGPGARSCILRAQKLGKPIHVGRVNSIKRFRYFQSLGCQSVDGTKVKHEPDWAVRTFSRLVSQPKLL